MLRAKLKGCAAIAHWAFRAMTATGLAITASAQLSPPAREIPLYTGVAPGSEKWNYQERTGGTPEVPQALNIVRPVLLYYPADKSKAAGTAMIVAPGGGFHTLMMSYEGVDVAKRLDQMGVEAFVLKYRTTYVDPDARPGAGRAGGSQPAAGRKGGMASTGPQAGQNVRELAGADGQQAVRLLRHRAAEFGLLPNRIGIIGYSAGGSVVMSTIYGPADARPDFAAPIYGFRAISEPPPAGAPPLFIAVAADDKTMGFQGSMDLFAAWIKAGVPAELHVFQIGQHGFLKKGGGADHYLDRLEEWLKVNGWLTKATN
jgi:acetyl esterase/lipase